MKPHVTLAVLFAVIGSIPARASAQTTGGIRGRVANATNGAPLDGVVVVARSSALQGEETVVSDRLGTFALPSLPPGHYRLHVERPDFRVADMSDVEVLLGQTTPVSIDLVPVALEAERMVVTGTAPAVDRGSTEIGTNVNREFIRATPSPRRYSQVLQLTPGASSDRHGTTILGATSPENSYVIEGLNTTETGFGRAATDMNTDFFEEIEIKTGGYMPEFGRSTGGIFNLVLQSGSNDLHGEVFVNVAPGFLQAEALPIDRAREGVGRRDQLDMMLDGGFMLGGPILRDRLWFFGGLNSELRLGTVNRFLQTRIDRVGDGVDTDPAYGLCADGSGPGSTADCEDADGDGVGDMADAAAEPRNSPDGEPDLDANGSPRVREVEGSNQELDRDRITHFLAGKLTFAATPNHRLSLSYFGNPETNTGVLLRSDEDNLGNNGVAGGRVWAQGERSSGSHNAILSYAGHFLDRHLQVEAFAGLHASHDVAEPTRAAQREGMIDHAYLTSLSTFEEGCPEIDSTPFIDCPVSEYRTGGQGFFRDERLSRATAGFRLTNLFSGHRIRYGFDTELKSFDATWGYTGEAAAWETHYARTAAEDSSMRSFLQQSFARSDPGAPGVPVIHGRDNVPPFHASVPTLTLSAFLQDSWEVDSYFTVNAGLRWDFEQLGGVDEPLLTIPDEFAPRLGFAFDPTRRGKVRLFASWGLYYESVPLDINMRSASRQGLVYRHADDDGNTVCFDTEGNPVPGGSPPACTYDPYSSSDANEDGQFQPEERGVFGGEYANVTNRIGGQYHEEFVVGAEAEVVRDWVVGVQAVSRRLGRVLEDISADGGNTYFIANPGQNDCDVGPEFRTALAEACSVDRNGDGDLSPDEYDPDATVFPEPTRTYLGLIFSVRKRLADHSQILASYTLSRTYGDYPGLYSPDNQQLDPNLSSQYDLPELLPNRLGLLPNDHTHSLKVAGAYELGGLNRTLNGLTVGLSYRGESGVPYSYLARHPSYGRNEAFILPRGTAGRTPFLHQFDAMLSYDIPVTRAIHLGLNATVFNMFNFQEATIVDQEYTTDVVLPQSPGTRLTDIRNDQGEPVNVNPTFGQARARQAPLSVVLGARLTF